MANTNGASRTNRFRVVDVAAFDRAMEPYEVVVIKDVEGMRGIYSTTEDGSMPTQFRLHKDLVTIAEPLHEEVHQAEGEPVRSAVEALVDKRATELGITLNSFDKEAVTDYVMAFDPDWDDVYFPYLVAQFLADGEVAVFMTSGHQKARFVTGYACAINNKKEEIELGLDDIYEMAQKKFGVTPTRAEY